MNQNTILQSLIKMVFVTKCKDKFQTGSNPVIMLYETGWDGMEWDGMG